MKLYEAIEKAMKDRDSVLRYIDGATYRLLDLAGEVCLQRTAPMDMSHPIGFSVTKWTHDCDIRAHIDMVEVKPSAWAMLFDGWEVDKPRKKFKPYSVDVWLDDEEPRPMDEYVHFIDRLFGEGTSYLHTEGPTHPHKFKITVEKGE